MLNRKRAAWLLCLTGLFVIQANPANAADLRDITVEKQHSRYHLTSRTYFAATQAQLYKVLTNFDLYPRFSSAFVEGENREPDDQGRPQFYTKMEGCVLLFCKAFIRYGYLELTPENDIVAIVDPERSNFKYSRERWQLIPEGEGTLMIYDFEMEPGFWVPPIIGPFVMKRSLRSAGTAAIDRIEALAQALGEAPD